MLQSRRRKNPPNVNLSIKSYEVRIICYNRTRRYTYFCWELYIILTMKNIFCFLTLLFSLCANAQITERTLPAEWKNLIDGGRFKDRFLPMPDGKSGENVWGTDSVRLRYVDNGIENPELSFWGGNILKGKDNKYHLFVCGWPENSPKGHMTWPKSTVFHTTSDCLSGPYTALLTLLSYHICLHSVRRCWREKFLHKVSGICL